LSIRRLGETAPRAGGVRQTDDDGSPEHVLQSGVVQSSGPQHTQRVPRLRARRHQPLDVLTAREVITDADAPSIFIQLLRVQAEAPALLLCVVACSL